MNISLRKRLVALSFLIICFIFLIVPSPIFILNASETIVEYSNVFEDLCNAENFDTGEYPVNTEDNTLSVIQVAESVDNELFIYVYQPNSPNADLQATCINMSIGDLNTATNKLYYLTLINSRGVFYKYKVNNFTIPNETQRDYNIISIYRKWHSRYDKDLDKFINNDITEVSFPVAKTFSIYNDENGNVYYSNSVIDIVTITEKFVSYLRYTNGTNIMPANTDAFYVAFSSDRKIEDLMEAQVEFIHYTYSYKTELLKQPGASGSLGAWEEDGKTYYFGQTTRTYGEHITENLTLNASKQENVSIGKFIFKTTFSWQQIESVNTFINDSNRPLSESTKQNLQDKDWVLNFYTAKYSEKTNSVMATPVERVENGTRVEDVTILRLKFKTAGVTYNLGVVDNKQNSTISPSDIIVGETLWSKFVNSIKSFFEKLGLALKIIFIIILICLAVPILILIWNIIKIIFCIITLPFKTIKKIKNKNKH